MKIKTVKFGIIALFVFITVSILPSFVYGMTFSDLNSGDFAYEAVSSLVDKGIINGYDDGKFYPNNPLKRSEYCKLVSVALELNTDKNGELPFSDIPKSHWSRNYIYACYNAGLIDGMGDGTFSPDGYLTYEQAVKILVCASKLASEVDKNVGEKWYSGYIKTAQNHGYLDDTLAIFGKSVSRATTAQLMYNAIDDLQDDGGKNNSVAATEAPEITTPTVSETVAPSLDNKNENVNKNEDVNNNSSAEINYHKNLIFIDAGHNYSGYDKGARGNELKEEEITWKIADKLRIALERNGFTVVMSRETMTSDVANTSVNESLNKRCEMANNCGAELFISIHCNTGGGTGVETYCYSETSGGYGLAAKVQNGIVKNTGMIDRKVKTANFVVVRETVMPAVLIETGFLDRAEDAEILGSESGQMKIAEGIAMGVCEYKNVAYVK